MPKMASIPFFGSWRSVGMIPKLRYIGKSKGRQFPAFVITAKTRLYH